MKPLKIYADSSHYLVKGFSFLADILKTYRNDLSVSERIAIYDSCYKSFEMVTDLDWADLVLLPLRWDYYVDNRSVELAWQTVSRAQQAGKPLVVFSEGDFAANVPFSNITIFERAGYRSRRGEQGNYIYALPSFISDYVLLYCQGKPVIRKKALRPVVGFCGQAGGTSFDFFRRAVVNRYRWLAYRLGFRKWEPAPFETTIFRKHILDLLAESPRIETNFLIRHQYRAGYWKSESKDLFHSTRLEFVNNINNTDYTVCMRGGGNFSVRFYQTLCLGRIPIFVDSDCILPFDDQIDYRRYCVWVDQSEIPNIAEKVADFHAALTPGEFQDLQIECRRLWQQYLSRDGFYDKFSLSFGELLDG